MDISGAFNDNKKPLIAGLAILLAAVGGFSLYANHRSAKEDAARNALFKATDALTAKIKTVTESNEESAPVEVEQQFGSLLKDLERVETDFPGTRAGVEARFERASVYFRFGKADLAIPLYEKAVRDAGSSVERIRALTGQAFALEKAGKFAEATDLFKKAAESSAGEKESVPLQIDLWLGAARAATLGGNKTGAKEIYDQIMKKYPNTDGARTAEMRLGELKS